MSTHTPESVAEVARDYFMNRREADMPHQPQAFEQFVFRHLPDVRLDVRNECYPAFVRSFFIVGEDGLRLDTPAAQQAGMLFRWPSRPNGSLSHEDRFLFPTRLAGLVSILVAVNKDGQFLHQSHEGADPLSCSGVHEVDGSLTTSVLLDDGKTRDRELFRYALDTDDLAEASPIFGKKPGLSVEPA